MDKIKNNVRKTLGIIIWFWLVVWVRLAQQSGIILMSEAKTEVSVKRQVHESQ